jgi:hypothetical protein
VPVSFLPVLYTALVLVFPLLFLRRGRTVVLRAVLVSALGIALPILLPMWQGSRLHAAATAGRAEAQYEFARWKENHAGQIGRFLLWPEQPDVEAGFEWLVRAAMQQHPPALFALGARLKHDQQVPEAWFERGIRRLPEERRAQGQAMIDEALARGFRPQTDDRNFYWFEFRRDFRPADRALLPSADGQPPVERSR